MPPKKTAAVLPEPTTSEAPQKETAEKKSGAAALRKLSAHPSTAVMVKEALQALDSRKGVSSQVIRSYIKEKYPSVDLVRLTHLVRNCLKKGIESGTLVRPANASVATGATGKFRLAPKAKELKSKAENVDPNEQTAPKAAKDGDEKPKKAACWGRFWRRKHISATCDNLAMVEAIDKGRSSVKSIMPYIRRITWQSVTDNFILSARMSRVTLTSLLMLSPVLNSRSSVASARQPNPLPPNAQN
ncbi:uncharacterized protein LOC142376588 [Odontesthes bonariensis]|uniref:uncharacterized protein LOC142376588 n=1 Tax=Odontesthes bonariensis TaxID=219752 RepID=UPI003F585454